MYYVYAPVYIRTVCNNYAFMTALSLTLLYKENLFVMRLTMLSSYNFVAIRTKK